MHIREVFKERQTTFSFESFPPRGRKACEGLFDVVRQLFFDNRDFFDFRERCAHAGIGVPIMALGARYPAALLKQLSRYDGDANIARVGVDWATGQCEDLLASGVGGVHFYTLNRSPATLAIFRRLGVQREPVSTKDRT